MEKSIVAREVAEAEFDRFAELMELDVAVDKMDKDDVEGFTEQKERFIRAVMAGKLIVSEQGEPRLQCGDREITFKEPTGATFIALGSRSGKKSNEMSSLYAAMGDMTGEAPAFFSRLKNRDVKICVAIATLFFGG